MKNNTEKKVDLTYPLFRLATFNSRQGPRVGLILGDHLIDLNHALSIYREKMGQNNQEGINFNSMLGLLGNWDDSFPLIFDIAVFINENPELDYQFNEMGKVELLAPVPNPGKMINVGLNFYDHAHEMGISIPEQGFQPNFFFKGDGNCIIGPSQKIRLSSNYVDWEAELALIIGKKAKNVGVADAMNYVAGYTCHNDVSDRSLLVKKDGSLDFFASKSRDTFAPLGPYLVPRQFVKDPRSLRIRCLLNDQVMQDSGADQFIWGPEECIAYLSSFMTLQPGDVISLGTGAGTGWAKGITTKNIDLSKLIEHMYNGGGIFLRSGDRITVEISGIGTLENQVAGP